MTNKNFEGDKELSNRLLQTHINAVKSYEIDHIPSLIQIYGIKSEKINIADIINESAAPLKVLLPDDEYEFLQNYDIPNITRDGKSISTLAIPIEYIENEENLTADEISKIFNKLLITLISKFDSVLLSLVQTKMKFALSSTKVLKDSDKLSNGLIIRAETPYKKLTNIYYTNEDNEVKIHENIPEDAIVNKTFSNMGVFNIKKNKEARQLTSIWSKLGIQKEYFGWIKDIIKESKQQSKSQTSMINEIIGDIKHTEFGETTEDINISEYEKKLFLAGKVFEQQLQK